MRSTIVDGAPVARGLYHAEVPFAWNTGLSAVAGFTSKYIQTYVRYGNMSA